MRARLYPKLAWMGIRKNKKLYLPYIFSGIGMVTMFCIIQSIECSPVVRNISGGSNLSMILSMGIYVIAAFALIFLLYSQSFLIRRRNKEFGLFNILGMDKNGITKVIVWESLIVSVLSMVAGLFFGVVLSKLCELLLLNIVHATVSYSFSLSAQAICMTTVIFAVIFFVLLIKSVWLVRRADPLELMHSDNLGEKPPKANWFFAVLGVLLLGLAYGMSVSIKSPLDAVFSFLIAVILVILATYLLFMSGSVALCKLLQRNKNYYYKKNHFVSVSSMTYRMKRNGAGLASICILSTMVLVMIASSSSLYFGADDAIRSRFPQQNQLSVRLSDLQYTQENYLDCIRRNYEKQFEIYGVKPENSTQYTYAEITGLLSKDGTIQADSDRIVETLTVYENLRTLYFINIRQYNELMGTNLTLKPNEAMVKTFQCTYSHSSVTLDALHLDIVKTLDEFPKLADANAAAVPSLMIVVSDLNVLEPIQNNVDYNGEQMLGIYYYYGYDLTAPEDVAVAVHKALKSTLDDVSFLQSDSGNSVRSSCLASERSDFYTTFGGLFFIGLVLSLVFIFAMAMIIYYKQISEGYEDCARFTIMQKVGMTKRDIKKNINSQVLTVFFAPLLFAGLHLAFAFSPIWKILQLFHLQNLSFVLIVTAIAFVLFGVFYAVLYKATAGAYFKIVSDTDE